MSENKKPYRVSISFPPEMADIIWAYAKEDERTFTWEVTNMLNDLFDDRWKSSYSTYTSSSIRDARYRHQKIVKQLREQKED